jgi:hypothetical protein
MLRTFVLLILCSSLVCAEEEPKAPAGGKFVAVSPDGDGWQHPGTSLYLPQQLGTFRMTKIFQADKADQGFTVTYTEERRGLRLDWLVYPPQAIIRDYASLLPRVTKEMQQNANWLQSISKAQGFYEASRSPVEEAKVPMWKRDPVPLFTQSFIMKAAQGPVLEPKPDLFYTLNLLYLEDYFVQTTLVMPSTLGEEAGTIREEAHNLVAAMIREPAMSEEMLKMAAQYALKPLEDEGRKAATTLLKLSAESHTMKPSFPGEGITACLNEAKATAAGTHDDLLRAFSVGSLVVQIQGGKFDDQVTEGARMMSEVFATLQKQKPELKSPACEKLAQAVKDGRAALHLREQMLAPLPK